MPPDRYETKPCLSQACRGVSRLFAVHVHRSGDGQPAAEVEICTVCGFNPGRVPADTPQADD